MRQVRRALTLVVSLAPVLANTAEFEFMAIGDTAYNGARDRAAYARLIEAINDEPIAFTVHVGDVWGVAYCSDDRMREELETLNSFRQPLFLTPGDNEWTDCHERIYGAFDAVDRLASLRKIFFNRAMSLGAKPAPLVRQSDVSSGPFEKFTENARWQHETVLFVTVNVPGSGNNYRYEDAASLREAEERTRANVAWLRDSFRIASAGDYAGVVLALHAEMFMNGAASDGIRGPHGPIIREIRLAAERFEGPVLLIHGDSHEFIVDRPFLESQGENAPPRYANVTRLEVFGAPDVRAVRVSIDTDSPWVFAFEPFYLAE